MVGITIEIKLWFQICLAYCGEKTFDLCSEWRGPKAVSSICQGNLKSSFISTVKPTVHTSPSRKWSVSKMLLNLEEFENANFSFSYEPKTFWKWNFLLMMASQRPCDFPGRVFLKYKSKMKGDCCAFKFFWRGVDRKHLMRFQSETSVFKAGLKFSLWGSCIPFCLFMEH